MDVLTALIQVSFTVTNIRSTFDVYTFYTQQKLADVLVVVGRRVIGLGVRWWLGPLAVLWAAATASNWSRGRPYQLMVTHILTLSPHMCLLTDLRSIPTHIHTITHHHHHHTITTIITLSHHHPSHITSSSHYHNIIITITLSHCHHHHTITTSSSPSHYHTLLLTLSLSQLIMGSWQTHPRISDQVGVANCAEKPL